MSQVRVPKSARDRLRELSRARSVHDEIAYLVQHPHAVPKCLLSEDRSVLFAGQAYYNAWYLSRELRKLGWRADLLNWDIDPTAQFLYHGCDFQFHASSPIEHLLEFYLDSLFRYSIFHFSNANGVGFGAALSQYFTRRFGSHSEVWLLKQLGRRVTYANNGCLDGVSQSAFSETTGGVCDECRWRSAPGVCSYQRNLGFGALRNAVSDYIALLGGNRTDWNATATAHECPWFYCLDADHWNPGIEIPPHLRVTPTDPGNVMVLRAFANRALRTGTTGKDIKSTYIYDPVFAGLEASGEPIEAFHAESVASRDMRFMVVQADIVADMLTYGWFGALGRESMMLGKPYVCYIRPSWLAQVARELPDYAAELPVISATPATVRGTLLELANDPDLRAEVGSRGRHFALKWHSSKVAAREFDRIFSALLEGSGPAPAPYPRLTEVRGVPLAEPTSRPSFADLRWTVRGASGARGHRWSWVSRPMWRGRGFASRLKRKMAPRRP